MDNKAKISFQGAVIDVNGSGGISQSALFFTAFKVKKERPQLQDVSILQGDVISFLQPYTAIVNALEITLQCTAAVVHELEDIRDALKLSPVKR